MINISTVSNNQSFSTWLERTRQICEIISQNTVTADSSSGGSLTTGNVYVNGYFYSVNFSTNSLRGGNNSSANILNIVSNTAIKNYDSSANIFLLTTNSITSSISLSGNNISFSPSSNLNISGILFNISATTLNITSSALNSVAVLTQTANVLLKSNSTTTAISFNGNNTVSTLNVSTSNTQLNGSNVTVTANLSVTGNFNVSGSNNNISNLSVTNILAINSATFSQDIITKGLTVNGSFIANLTSSFVGNASFGSVFVVNTANNKITMGGAVADASSILTVNGTITADTFRFPDGSLVPSSNSLTSIGQANASVAVNGSGQIVLTSNNSTIGIIDAASNGFNFSNQSIRANTLTLSSSLTSNSINVVSGSINTLIINTYSASISNKVEISNSSVLTIDNVSATGIRACDWTIELEDANTASFQLSKIMSIHDGSTTAVTEYAVLYTNNAIGTLTTDISGGQMRLRLTPSIYPATAKIIRTGITA